MRLLLIEDDVILGSSLKKALEKHAYGVDWMQDGESGLAALEDLIFSVVVLDVNLPKLDRNQCAESSAAKKEHGSDLAADGAGYSATEG